MSGGIAVLGTKATCLHLIEAVKGSDLRTIVTLDDASDSRSETDAILGAATRLSVPVHVASSASTAYDLVRDAQPAVVFVAGWYRLIPDDVLAAVPQGFVGIHYSRLPEYRGSAPVVWAIINGDSSIGYSIFRMVSEMDEGPIAAQGSVKIDETTYIDEALRMLDEASLSALSGIADSIAQGTHPFLPQEATGASYGSMRSPGDGLIDWTMPAVEIARHVRAQSRPYPGAHTFASEMKVTIWRARPADDAAYFGVPGHVVRMIGDVPVVACGEGSGLILDETEARHGLRVSLATQFY